MQRPYHRCSDKSVNNNDPMNMVWHNNECIQTDKRKMYNINGSDKKALLADNLYFNASLVLDMLVVLFLFPPAIPVISSFL